MHSSLSHLLSHWSFCLLCTVFPHFLTPSCLPHRWLYGKTVCSIYAFCGMLFGICSLTTLTLLSVVCFVKVCYPIYGKSSKKLFFCPSVADCWFIWGRKCSDNPSTKHFTLAFLWGLISPKAAPNKHYLLCRFMQSNKALCLNSWGGVLRQCHGKVFAPKSHLQITKLI